MKVGAALCFVLSALLLALGWFFVSFGNAWTGDSWSSRQVVGVVVVAGVPFVLGLLLLVWGGVIGHKSAFALSVGVGLLAVLAGMWAVGRGGTDWQVYRTASLPAWSPDGERIAFVRTTWTPHKERSEDTTWTHASAIVVMGVDGGRTRQLTRPEKLRDETAPAWSADGRRIAYVIGEGSTADIAVVNAGGGGRRILAGTPRAESDPVWSPDGRHVAYVVGRGRASEVWVMDANGSGKRRLTRNQALDDDPAWSPDGRRIAFSSDRTRRPRVYVMEADGRSQRQLASTDFASSPAWSPDGRRITFDAGRIYVVNDDGTGLRRLRYAGAEEWVDGRNCGWSPDGRWVLIEQDDGSQTDVFIASVDRPASRDLTAQPNALWESNDVEPSWSPDGRRIVYARGPEQPINVWVMRSDGTGKRRLTDM